MESFYSCMMSPWWVQGVHSLLVTSGPPTIPKEKGKEEATALPSQYEPKDVLCPTRGASGTALGNGAKYACLEELGGGLCQSQGSEEDFLSHTLLEQPRGCCSSMLA